MRLFRPADCHAGPLVKRRWPDQSFLKASAGVMDVAILAGR